MEQEIIVALLGMGILVKKHQERYVVNVLRSMEEDEKEKDIYNRKIMYLAILLAQQDRLNDTVVIDMMKMEGNYNE